VSLLVWEGRTMLKVAAQAGHGVDVCELSYARIFEGNDPARRTSAEQAMQAARRSEGRPMDVIRGETNACDQATRRKTPAYDTKPTGGLEPPTPSLRVMCSTS
jgi:hypothetical protein